MKGNTKESFEGLIPSVFRSPEVVKAMETVNRQLLGEIMMAEYRKADRYRRAARRRRRFAFFIRLWRRFFAKRYWL